MPESDTYSTTYIKPDEMFKNKDEILFVTGHIFKTFKAYRSEDNRYRTIFRPTRCLIIETLEQKD